MFSLRKESSSVNATENLAHKQDNLAEAALEGKHAPVPSLTISGDENKIDLQVAQEPYNQRSKFMGGLATNARSTEHWTYDLTTSIPLGISLLLVAAGLAAIILAIRSARRSSAAIDTGFQAADNALAAMIRQFRSKAASKPTPEIHAAIADLEAERGRLQSNKP